MKKVDRPSWLNWLYLFIFILSSIQLFWFDAKNINCFKNGFRVIKDLNLKIAYSENVILIGPNGSGKSFQVNHL